MDIVHDTKSGLSFCAKTGDKYAATVKETGVPDFDLIQWCIQFLDADKNAIDVGSELGIYTVILAPKCKTVYTFHADKDIVSINIGLNNRMNTERYADALGFRSPETHRTVDSFDIKDVCFVNISSEVDTLNIIKGMSVTLYDSNFPPILFTQSTDDNSVKAFLRNLGYNVSNVSGYSTRFIASDNPLYKSKSQAAGSYNISMLERDYDSGALHKSDATWDQWHALAKHYRLNGQNEKSYKCCHEALKHEIPRDKLFLIHEELSIVSFYVGEKDEGYVSSDKVILSRYAPWETKKITLNNLGFYLKKPLFKRIIPVKIDMPESYIASSSSIIPYGSGYLMNVRGVNYSIRDDGSYDIRDPDGIVRTVNMHVEMNANFEIGATSQLCDNSGVQFFDHNIKGLEDLRMFSPTQFFCTNLEVNADRIPQICYGVFEHPEPDFSVVTSLTPLMIGDKVQCEKNWLPFMKDGSLHFVYSIEPLRIYKLLPDNTTELVAHSDNVGEPCINDFRGSAPLIPYNDGWLGTIHEVAYTSPRKYYHRFIFFGSNFDSIKYSEAFTFEHVGIEFNLSICHSPAGLLVPYSVKDNCSKIAVLSYNQLNKWLGLD